ncbi:amylo-alpha-1,6-glucosidase [Pyrinomonas methylaliphatogenes]|uniref:Glycogen debranching enzyme n=1 Tax=Pyrinomonas methylaliphatogenes TaxID=454194 RepID=A0A0B6WTJ7_9BACT|nr:GH116 family glycosyl hydrolase [Pyrinomonas methylaliphatogenes]CDM64361.1 glycogen debranching enzyme [Pyrinomonas methylaliphatogenes]
MGIEKIIVLLLFSFMCSVPASALMSGQSDNAEKDLVPRFEFPRSGMELARRTRQGEFFDVVGRRAAVFGYENRSCEAWVYPLKILDDFRLSFQLEGYPLEIQGSEIAKSIAVRPEATTFVYSHAAFTVRQIIFTPVDEPAIVMLFDVESVLPLTITASFRPRLRLMWPAGSMTANLSWDERGRVYYLTEETNCLVGMIGSPLAEDISVMPYQEEPRDQPNRFRMRILPDEARRFLIPVVIVGSAEGRGYAQATYNGVLGSIPRLYAKNVEYYANLQRETLEIATPDDKLNRAFAWAKVGIDKGIVDNPMLGTGLVAGFRSSGESERPGFAWYFGRDALWTAFALISYGDWAGVRTALGFLAKYQRADGKIPHEIAQSAALTGWFTNYPYAWASADATPLYVIAHADYWRASGDVEFIRRQWDSIRRAYEFSAKTDTDGNGLIENTGVGHGWVEGGALYPPHEEIYLQGLWIEASRGLAELAALMGDMKLAQTAQANAERARAAVERTYWLADRGFYAFATHRPQMQIAEAERGPNRESRQKRLAELSRATLIDEDTVLPAVALWWGLLDAGRAESELDHLGGGAMMTDWGARLISRESQLYDPLSYHYGSVWPLFTGWVAMGAYRYGRPHIGYQALMANAQLSFEGALGYVTELLSGEFNAAFGRSSHHQVWSEAMVITPLVRGLLGLEARAGGRELRFMPQLPATWDQVSVRRFAIGGERVDLSLRRSAGQLRIDVGRSGAAAGDRSRGLKFTFGPAFPSDARVRAVKLNGRRVPFRIERMGEIQRAIVTIEDESLPFAAVFDYDEGTEVYVEPQPLEPGARSQGLRLLRAFANADGLRLIIEGVGGKTYPLYVRSPREIERASGARVGESVKESGRVKERVIYVTFDGDPERYWRREVAVIFKPARGAKGE